MAGHLSRLASSCLEDMELLLDLDPEMNKGRMAGGAPSKHQQRSWGGGGGMGQLRLCVQGQPI